MQAEFATSERSVRLKSERSEYRLYFALMWPVCFIGALISRGLGGVAKKSVFEQASASVDSILPWVFSGR